MTTTRRLYHEDPELRTFEASVQAVEPAGEGAFDIVLDRTAFYPTGGGQPHDTGRLGDAAVTDVWEAGDVVVHRVDRSLGLGAVRGEVDWTRRLDHRRQHTGQHILSRAFEEEAGAATVGFHLGTDRCSIDLDRADVGTAALERTEARANAVVLENLPVTTAWYEDPASVPGGVRKAFPGPGPVRLVSIGDFDRNPCCGTHCLRTGEVGPVKILRTERKKGGTRVEFLCGTRALTDYVRRYRALRSVALALTTEDLEVPARVAALREEQKALRARLEKAEEDLRARLVSEWAGEVGTGLLVRGLDADRSAWLTPLAGALGEASARPVFLSVVEGARAQVVLALPAGVAGHAGNTLKEALAAAEGRGGGSDRLGRGRLPAEGLDLLIQTLKGEPWKH